MKKGEKQTMDSILKKTIQFMWLVFFFLMFGLILAFFLFPKIREINQSKHFTDAKIKRYSQTVLTAIEELDYETLEVFSTEDLLSELSEDALQRAKSDICPSFGKRVEIKEWYLSEVRQKNQFFAVARLDVTYENVIVSYTFSFDEEMKLAGLYMDGQSE